MTLAHSPLPRGALGSTWAVEPFAIAVAVLAVALYVRGLDAAGIRAVGRARAWSFAAGIALALLAVTSPLHAAAEVAFSAHMVQHQILILVAAPLIVAGRPAFVMALALPIRMRQLGRRASRAGPLAVASRLLRNPLTLLLAYAGVVWIWHLPSPYQKAVTDEAVHAAEHAAFAGAALAFWAAVTRTGPRRRMHAVPAMLLVLGTMLHSTWLAAVLTFGEPAYPIYMRRAPLWGVEALTDQQIAGAIMWIPSSIVFMIVFGVLFVRWLRDLDARHAQRVSAVTVP